MIRPSRDAREELRDVPKRLVLTIDGPAGAGKSTVARGVAARLGWRFLDTGAMYRAASVAALRAGIDMSRDDLFGDLVDSLKVESSEGRVLLNGEDVTSLIRTTEITRISRYAASSPRVRLRLVAWQREFASAARRVVTEGRDQGTIVFPDAFLKFYLTATDESRARRRLAEQVSRGEEITFQDILRDIRERDARDASRDIAPMRPADDARILDTSDLTLESVLGFVENAARSALVALEPIAADPLT